MLLPIVILFPFFIALVLVAISLTINRIFKNSRPVRTSLLLGFSFGILGLMLIWSLYFFDKGGEAYEGSMWLLLICGFPVTLLYVSLSLAEILSSPGMDEICLSILFLANWSIVGYLTGLILSAIFKKTIELIYLIQWRFSLPANNI